MAAPALTFGATASTLGALIPFAGTLIASRLEKRGDMGRAGDLIVAVDDKRVRNQKDLDDAVANLKPGDTMYLTVIRPGPEGSHTTQKLAVHVGPVGQPVANAGRAADGIAFARTSDNCGAAVNPSRAIL